MSACQLIAILSVQHFSLFHSPSSNQLILQAMHGEISNDGHALETEDDYKDSNYS